MKKIIVFKCGGSVIWELFEEFFDNLKELMVLGWKLVIVYGGGLEIINMLKWLNIKIEFLGGQCKIMKLVLEVVEMVLLGFVNKFFVVEFVKYGLCVVGIFGKDGGFLEVDYFDLEIYGEVGEIKKVDVFMVNVLMEKGIIFVIVLLFMMRDCKMLNVNVDLVVFVVVGVFEVDKLMFVIDVDGIMKDKQCFDVLIFEEV